MFPSAKVVAIKRRAVERLYRDTATISTEVQSTPDPVTGRIVNQTVTTGPYSCRLSYKNFPEAKQGDGIAEFMQTITLFIAPELVIKAGSVITVTHEGRTLEFTASGVPAVYSDHQEIVLENRVKHDG